MRQMQVKIASTGELYPMMPPDPLTRGGGLGPGSTRDEAIVAASRQRGKCPPRDWGVQEVGLGTCTGVGGGRNNLLLALVVWPLTTRPFRDGAPFLLLIEATRTFGRSLRFFPYITLFFFAFLIPTLFRRLWAPSIS